MVELTSTLPDPASMAQFCVAVLTIIVIWDAWWLGRQRIDIPILGEIPFVLDSEILSSILPLTSRNPLIED